MDTLDFGRNKVSPIGPGDHVLVAEEAGRDRHGRDAPPHQERTRKKNLTAPAADEATNKADPGAPRNHGCIIDIKI